MPRTTEATSAEADPWPSGDASPSSSSRVASPSSSRTARSTACRTISREEALLDPPGLDGLGHAARTAQHDDRPRVGIPAGADHRQSRVGPVLPIVLRWSRRGRGRADRGRETPPGDRTGQAIRGQQRRDVSINHHARPDDRRQGDRRGDDPSRRSAIPRRTHPGRGPPRPGRGRQLAATRTTAHRRVGGDLDETLLATRAERRDAWHRRIPGRNDLGSRDSGARRKSLVPGESGGELPRALSRQDAIISSCFVPNSRNLSTMKARDPSHTRRIGPILGQGARMGMSGRSLYDVI